MSDMGIGRSLTPKNIEGRLSPEATKMTVGGSIILALTTALTLLKEKVIAFVRKMALRNTYGAFNEDGTLGKEKMISTSSEKDVINDAAVFLESDVDSVKSESFYSLDYKVNIYKGQKYSSEMDFEKKRAEDHLATENSIEEFGLSNIGVSECIYIENDSPRRIASAIRRSDSLDYNLVYSDKDKSNKSFDSVAGDFTKLAIKGKVDHLMGDFIKTGGFKSIVRAYISLKDKKYSQPNAYSNPAHLAPAFPTDRKNVLRISGQKDGQYSLDIEIAKNEVIVDDYKKDFTPSMRRALMAVWLFPKNFDKIMEEMKNNDIKFEPREENFLRIVSEVYTSTLSPKVKTSNPGSRP
ncbi:MAG: hypothetical protein KAH32_05360 [Chlamydiia bacterium]|nr:hypothetical protein [Chlamydiia bacterium]